MARELIEVNPNDEPAVPLRARANRGRELTVRTSAGYREEDFPRSYDSGDSPSPNSSRKTAERSRKRAVANDGDDNISLELEDDDEVQFLRARRRVPVKRNVLPRNVAHRVKLAAVIVGSALILGGAGATAYGYAMHSWRFRISSSENIEISGVHNASHAHVMEVAGADIGRNIFFVPLEERQHQLEKIPWVESATVMRLLPDRIAVTIKERTPVAFAQIGPRISLIDANGVIMDMPADRKTKYSFPVIRGISDTEPLSSRAAAMKIYNHMAAELDSGGQDGARYTRQLSEVDLSDPEDVKVMADEGGGALLIHLGSSNFLQRYKLYLAHIAEWRRQFADLQSVDLRYDGQIIVNPDKPAATTSQATPPAAAAPAKPVHRGGAAARRKHWRRRAKS
ncbi:MAG: cell division protein FtsQ/DivIB [Actinomycetota bacterium]